MVSLKVIAFCCVFHSAITFTVISFKQLSEYFILKGLTLHTNMLQLFIYGI